MSKKIIILVKVDDSCNMAWVSVDGESVMEGNFWDFHPGCHGIHKYGDFKGYNSLAQAIRRKLIKDGKDPSDISIEKTSYKWGI